MNRSRLERLSRTYVAFLQTNYKWVLVCAVILTILGGLSASRFELKTDFAELLPQNEPSIHELDRAARRMGGLSNFIVAVMGPNPEANRKLVDDLVAKYETLPKEYVTYLKYDLREETSFYEEHKHLYANLEDLEEIYERLSEKLRYERIKNNPLLNIDFDGDELEPVEFDVSDIRDKYKKEIQDYERYIDGYLTGEQGHLYAILIYPSAVSTGVDFGKRMSALIERASAEVCKGSPLPLDADPAQVVAECCPKNYAGAEIGFTGGVVTAIVEQQAIIADLILVTCVCLFFIALAILVYFRIVRSLPIIGVPLLMGTTWTFGISIYIVETLNTSTAFLAAIIVGNGINFGLIQLARFIEEKRAGKSTEVALEIALHFTARATSTAALAASIAYGSLIITDFRGFNGFGYMGGLGMILCWIAAFTVQPAILLWIERIIPIKEKIISGVQGEGLFVRPYSRFVSRFGVPLHILGWIFAFVCILVAIPYLKDPFEYNFRNLRNKEAQESGAGALSSRVDKIFTERLNPSFILADRSDQVPLIIAELKQNNNRGPYQGLFQSIKSIHSFLPQDQAKKIRVLKKIRRKLTKSTLSWLSLEEKEEVDRFIPPQNLRALTPKDLPLAITRPFTEKDGRVGLAVALYPRKGRSIWDGHFLMELSQASRVVRLPDGEEVTSAGVGTVFAEMIHAIARDGPRAVIVSLLGVILLVCVIYRRTHLAWLIIMSLFFGVVWTVGPAAMIKMKLNFLNFIALPITFGIGIDYAVNVLNRYRIEGKGSMERVIASTGGAVILCSLTTFIGYSSLLISDTQALVSFGLLADIGEVASLAAALLVLPVMVKVSERRRDRIIAQKYRKI